MIDDLIADLLKREGGYVNSSADRGGETNFGITLQVARANGYTGPMAAMPRTVAAAIYRVQYWTQPGFDQINALCPALATEMFDIGVNMGTATAGIFAQRALNVLNRGATDYPDVKPDGQFGAVSRLALQTYLQKRPGTEGIAVLMLAVRGLRTDRYIELAEKSPSQETFEYGWLARQARAA